MNLMEQFTDVIEYIENNLENDISYDELAAMVGYSVYHLQRLFLLIAGVSLAEYIRNRRLAKAAEDLMSVDAKVIDIALKYGYSSPTSFNRAFKAMHGLPPSDVKDGDAMIKAFPPLSFDLAVRGAGAMDYRVEQHGAFRIVGKKLETTIENGECYNRVPAFWAELVESGGPGEILALMDAPPFGLLGVSDYDPAAETSSFNYFIAVSSDKPAPAGMAEHKVPAATWAIFPHPPQADPAEMQDYQKRIVFEWLPASGYEFGRGPDVELYYDDGRVETWVPVIKKQ